MAEKTETAKKIFRYRGKTLEELKSMEVREFSKYLKSRARRTIIRQFDDVGKFVNRAKEKVARNKQVKTHRRDLIIVPSMIGMRINVHNGKAFIPVDITGEMLGHRLGEFSLTRGKIKHGKAGVGATKGTKSQSKK